MLAATTRMWALSSRSSPAGEQQGSSSRRSSLGCSSSGSSPTSSRNRVPPRAAAIRPAWSCTVPVKAPRTCPNSSLSSRSAGRAAQFSGTHGPRRRLPVLCSARATSSFPVPLSPETSTLASESASRRTRWKILRMAEERPIISANSLSRSGAPSSSVRVSRQPRLRSPSWPRPRRGLTDTATGRGSWSSGASQVVMPATRWRVRRALVTGQSAPHSRLPSTSAQWAPRMSASSMPTSSPSRLLARAIR